MTDKRPVLRLPAREPAVQLLRIARTERSQGGTELICIVGCVPKPRGRDDGPHGRFFRSSCSSAAVLLRRPVIPLGRLD